MSGLFAVAGVPGDTFATMLAPLPAARPVARAVTVNLARVMKYSGWALTPITQRLPVGPRTIAVMTRTGFMFPMPDRELAASAVREFLATPVDWYFHLALSTSRHARVRLSQIIVPACFVAASYDVMAGSRDMLSAAERLEDATYVELRGSHFIQMEQPEQVHELLLDFLARVGPERRASARPRGRDGPGVAGTGRLQRRPRRSGRRPRDRHRDHDVTGTDGVEAD